jgi:hypothetical protein
MRELRELKPTVVHFSGHGGAQMPRAPGAAQCRDIVAASDSSGPEQHGLYFQDATGAARGVSAYAIAQTLGAAGASVKLVVLNACFTEPIAAALVAHVDCVAGMSGSIRDGAARVSAARAAFFLGSTSGGSLR